MLSTYPNSRFGQLIVAGKLRAKRLLHRNSADGDLKMTSPQNKPKSKWQLSAISDAESRSRSRLAAATEVVAASADRIRWPRICRFSALLLNTSC